MCEVEVDPDTGAVTLDRYVLVDDVGTVINPLTLKGQIHGGIAQGVGQALMEQIVYDARVGPAPDRDVHGLRDAARRRLLRHRDRAATRCPTKLNPMGAKGAGEAGTVGALPVVMSAVNDALALLGVRDFEMPATSDRVWDAIQKVTPLARTS